MAEGRTIKLMLRCFGEAHEDVGELSAPTGRRVKAEQRREAKDGGGKRQAVQIIAGTVQFLGRRGEGNDEVKDRFASAPQPAAVGADEEALPF